MNIQRFFLLFGLLVSFPFASTFAKNKSANDKVGVFFTNLKEGQKIPGDYLLKFEVHGKKVHEAGKLVEGTGHHHLIIDGGPVPTGQVVPATEKHIHFGKGQTEYKLNLQPGKYKLTLQFADGIHMSYGETFSNSVNVVVEEPKK